MKYKTSDILYYVCPFVFIIEKVKISLAVKEEDNRIYYIDHSGAYLEENDLFDNLKEARMDALQKLRKFYEESKYRILNDKPSYGTDGF